MIISHIDSKFLMINHGMEEGTVYLENMFKRRNRYIHGSLVNITIL